MSPAPTPKTDFCKKFLTRTSGRGIGNYPGTGTSTSVFFDARQKRGFVGDQEGMWSYSVSQHGWNSHHPGYEHAVPMKIGLDGKPTPAWKVDYLTFRDMLYEALMDPTPNRSIIQGIQKIIEPLIPVRTGHLASTILSTLRITRHSLLKTRYYFNGTYEYPRQKGTHLYRPYFIDHPKNNPPDTGYGNPRGINQQYKVKNVTMIRKTKKGNALYLLNDPGAHNDPRFVINKIIHEILIDIPATIFNNLQMEVTI